MSSNNGILLKCIFNPSILTNLLDSCFLMNLDFFTIHTAHFDKRVIFAVLVSAN